MKMFFAFFICFLHSLFIMGQIAHIDSKLQNDHVSFVCNFFDQNTQYIPPPAKNISNANSENWMRAMVDKITATVGLKNRFRLRLVENYNNCAALCIDNNIGTERFIQYDRDFLEAYQTKTKNKWFVVGVLAHELGHHLNGHSLDGIGSRPDKELDADEFAGFVLQKLGANINDASNIFNFLNDTDGPPTHPVKWKRKAAVSRGWTKANGDSLFASLYVLDNTEKNEEAFNLLMKARNEVINIKKLLLLNKALEIVPDYAAAISDKGLVYMNLHDYKEAYKYCINALELEPYIGLLRLNLAKVYADQKKYDTALAYVQDAIYLKPVFPEAYYFRASIFFENKNFTQTISDCIMALAMNPTKPFFKAEILETQGFALYELNKKEDATLCFEEARKLNPYSIKVLLYLASKKEKKNI